MSAITVVHERGDTKGKYTANVDGKIDAAELTYSIASPTLVIVDHTGVSASLRGTGVGAALARHVVAEARASGFKILPLCPFFKAQAMRHPDRADVVQG